MSTGTPKLTEIQFRCDAEEVSRARAATRRRLRGKSQELIERAEHCVSETIANAITHSASQATSGLVSLVLIELDDRIRVEVIDDGSESNRPTVIEDPDDETGRGLVIVAQLSDDWGFHLDHSGCNVWFELKF
ncbi:ATP-binding protein [Actinomadura terrae]|uniref:ATP-binding protein n=1 Tax=Actinomadura terrae TaxID=604353 RepID=UPI001FA7DF4C|nr:ATP-binding protein [Actinomadura terrae]